MRTVNTGYVFAIYVLKNIQMTGILAVVWKISPYIFRNLQYTDEEVDGLDITHSTSPSTLIVLTLSPLRAVERFLCHIGDIVITYSG